MDSSFVPAKPISSLSIIPGRPLHHLTESIAQGIICGRYGRCFRHWPHGFLGSRHKAHRRTKEGRAPENKAGEVQYRRAELSIRGPAPSAALSRCGLTGESPLVVPEAQSAISSGRAQTKTLFRRRGGEKAERQKVKAERGSE